MPFNRSSVALCLMWMSGASPTETCGSQPIPVRSLSYSHAWPSPSLWLHSPTRERDPTRSSTVGKVYDSNLVTDNIRNLRHLYQNKNVAFLPA